MTSSRQLHVKRVVKQVYRYEPDVRGGRADAGQAPPLVVLGRGMVHLDPSDWKIAEAKRPTVVARANQHYLTDPSLDRLKQFVVDETGAGRHTGGTSEADAEHGDRQVLVEAKLCGRVTLGWALIVQSGSLGGDPSGRPRGSPLLHGDKLRHMESRERQGGLPHCRATRRPIPFIDSIPYPQNA